MRQDLTALSYWFPKIEAAGVPVPRTVLLDMQRAAQECVFAAFDGDSGPDNGSALTTFLDEIDAAAKTVGGYPFFLRSDHTSGKHNWDKNCFVQTPEALSRHIFGIVEYSEMAGVLGLPWDRWAVSEFLPTIPLGVCPGFGDMPICKEFRFFVEDGKVRCWHPYWPEHALEQGEAPDDLDFEALCRMDDEHALRALAEAAGRAVGGSWSIDILETKRGWFVTDMAEAHKSFHWEGCEHEHATAD